MQVLNAESSSKRTPTHDFTTSIASRFGPIFPKVTPVVTEGQEPWTRLPPVLSPVF